MKEYYEVTATIVLEEDETTKINVTVEFDKEDENYFSLYFHQPRTNDRCEFLAKIFENWHERDKEEQDKWEELERRINQNNDLLEHLANDVPTHYDYIIDKNGWLAEVVVNDKKEG